MNAVGPLEGIRLATVDGLKPYGRPENSSPPPRTGRTQLDAVPLATIQEGLSVGRTTARLRTAALGLIQGGYRP
ncbi:hypothetical protein [Streptomyces glycanivorans]|uniref:Uncharacterized protein n=1 Tax=Streptomyces glycanivorans TaxID=3033808 RepID=A0ABY9J3A3_9ACTN|nr:hypothetical protein [Streptomyces sp. Alt3]WLQ62070.1 hypothetical protein P8A20_00005 [Streptomyces sp. Alt3]